jgi:hypothetical protein
MFTKINIFNYIPQNSSYKIQIGTNNK